MARILLILLCSLYLNLTVYSQHKDSLKETFLEAEYYSLYEDYTEALALYLDIYNKGLNNAYIQHRIGECYLHIPGQKHKAIPFLEEACKNISDDIKEGSFKETKAPTRTLFYLGDAYQVDNQLDKAIEAYKKFKESLEVQDIYNIDYVDQQIQSCQNAKDLMSKPVKIRKTNIGEKINDGFSNINPVLSPDENAIIYISKLKFYDAILYSNKESGDTWTSPININSDIKSDGDFYPCYLSLDKKTLILFRFENLSGDIYISKFENNKWQTPKKLNRHINSKSFETHGALSPDGKTLYFTSDRKDGYGGLDIYKSIYNETTKDWGEAINLGSEINTPLDEETPVLTEDGKTLYFSSQGHYNMGGFDVFYSKKVGENEWTTPVNMGYPINTTDDDIFFYPVKNGNYAYVSIYDKGSYGQKDIYKIEVFSPEHPFLVNVRGDVSLQDNKTDFNKNDFYVEILNSSNDESIKKIYMEENTGNFSVDLPTGEYKFNFIGKDYKPEVKKIIIPEDYSQEELVFNVELVPLAVSTGEYVTINNIYFNFDDFSLTKEAKIELERLYNLMLKYPSLQIEVIGHTDSKGLSEYNKELSEKRARSTINYLIEKGIEKPRFVSKGAGMEQPLAININSDGSDNPEGRKYNRRVETKVLKSDSKITIIGDYNIPAHLVNKDFYYCILITEENQELPQNYFDKYDALKKYQIKNYQNNGFLYILGNSKEKSELIEIYNVILELGFSDAKIISNYDLENLLR